MITIVPYAGKYQPDFKRLNLIWLEQYDLVETHDLEILDDPKGEVLDKGGCIFLAVDGEKIIATAGLAKENDETFELVKMAVDPAYRGQGISKTLLDRCLDEAKKAGAKKVILFSNSQLTTALKLYEQYGFKHVSAENSPFLTADVKMELEF